MALSQNLFTEYCITLKIVSCLKKFSFVFTIIYIESYLQNLQMLVENSLKTYSTRWSFWNMSVLILILTIQFSTIIHVNIRFFTFIYINYYQIQKQTFNLYAHINCTQFIVVSQTYTLSTNSGCNSPWKGQILATDT